MKKRINILMSISIVCAAASTSAIAAMCSISNNSAKKYNEAKSRLLNLIKKLDNEGQKKANDFIARQDKKFNSTAFKNHSNTSKLIDEIEIFSKKILENLQKDEKQRLEELNKLNKLRLDLQNLINSNDGQNVDSSDAKKALKENQIDDSLPIDEIKKTNENLENAKKELLNKINAEKELQSKIFNDKKQELKRVLDLEDAKEVDSIKEQKVYIETNISEVSSIEDIKNKIIEVEKATSSLTSKILNTKQQELQRFENIKKDLQDFINTKLNDAKYQSIKQKALDKINSLNDINKDSTIKEIKAGQNALIKAKEEAGLEKEKLDNQNIKDTLKETINNAKEFKKLLIDNDQKIVDLKSNLDNEISKAEQSLSKDKESMESANDLLNTKLIEYKEILNKFNQEKEVKFNELEQTRSQIEAFINANKTNPNYATLVKDLTNAKDAKKSVTNSSNKSDIIAANEALIQALADANKAKDQVDEANKSIKEQLNALIDKANTLLPQLVDSDKDIQKAKTELNQEIQNANQAVASNETASMQSAKSSLDDKVTKIQNQLTEFNKDKDAKFKELEQARKNIDNFLTDDVKNNPNYATLVKDLANAKDAKKSVTKSSNKSDIIAANEALKQALEKAKVAKDQVDEANKSIKEQLSDSITNANQLLNKLVDSDKDIQKAKTELIQEIQSASQELNLNNPTSMQSAKESLNAKVTEITKKLETFNKDKDAKFKELQQTRKDIDEFINTNKTNPNYSTLISELTSKRDSKNSITNSSNKSDIETANIELKQALVKANTDKAQADNLARSTKEQLNKSISSANTLLAKLTDKDNTIQQAKTELEKEVQKANQAVASNNTASMQSAKSSLDAKVTEITKKLETFNKDKDAKFKELQQTRKDIDEFINTNKTNPNYSELISQLTSKRDSKNSVTNSSNKLDIEIANTELKQALVKANADKAQADNLARSTKEQLNKSISSANTLLAKLTDKDNTIQQAKTELEKEVQKANQTVASNNTVSMQSAKSSLDAKVTEITKKLETFNKDKDAKFKELQQTRKDIDEFINTNKTNSNYSELISQLTSKRDSKNSVTNSSNKSDIETANTELKQALVKANTDKAQADNLARSTKEQLNKSISSANTLLAKLTDKDNTIQQAKTELEKEVQKANQAVASNNTVSMQSAKKSLDAKVTEITKKLETFNKDKDAKFKELEQTRKDIDEFIKQIENDPQTKKNYQNIVKNLKDKKAEKNSITFSNNKKEIQDANKSLQDELNNAKITKKGITDFYNSKKQLEDLIKTDDAKKVGTTEADTILDHYKNISDASKNEEIKQATQKINDIKKIIETKIQEKKRNEFSQFEQIKNELQSFINKDLKDQKYNSIRTKIENKINGVSSINKNSKIQDIENAKKQLEPAKNEFEKIINNIKKFNSQKQKVEEKLKFLDTKDIGTSGSLSNKNKDIKAIFQGFINEIEKELINKNADDKAKDECINKIIFLDKALISRYEGILNVAYKFFGDTSTQNNQTEKNEFFDNLRNNLVDQKVFDQLEKMNMNHFEDFYNTFYNKGIVPLKDGKPNYDDPKYKEEINKQNELEGPAVKWSAFDDILDAAFVRTAQTSFENKCKNLFNDHKKDDERYGTINKTLNVYDIDIYSKTGRADANDLDLRNKDKIFKGHEYVTFKFSTENVPGRWQKNFKGLAKWDGSKNRYRFVGIVSINLKYEYNLIISTKGENYKKPLSLEYKLGSNNKGQNYNPIIIDKISGIN